MTGTLRKTQWLLRQKRLLFWPHHPLRLLLLQPSVLTWKGSCALPTVRVPAAPGTPTPNTRDLGLLSAQMRPPLHQEWGTEWQPAEPRRDSTLEMFYRGRLSVSSASSRKTEKALRSGCSSSERWARGGARWGSQVCGQDTTRTH